MGINYYYQGISLRKYCLDNGLKYRTITKRINSLKIKYPNLSLEEVITFAINGTFSRDKYFYNGILLSDYCRDNNLNCNTIIKRIYKLKNNNPNLDLNTIVSMAVEEDTNYCRYYYKGVTFYKYCKDNNIDYYKFFRMIRRKFSLDDGITDEMVDYYNKRVYLGNLKNIFNKLDNMKDCCDYNEIIEFLNIDYDSIILLKNNGFNIKDSIYFIWYFGINNDGLIKVNQDIINTYINKDCNYDELDIVQLIGIYKSNVFDSRNIIIKYFENNIIKFKNNIKNKYIKYFNSDLEEELLSVGNYYLLEFLLKTNSNNKGDIINYFNRYVYGNMIRYYIEYLNINSFKGIDFDYNNSFDFGNFEEIILSLDPLEQLVIVYKFKYLYSFLEISNVLDISIDEVNNIYNNSLEKIKLILKDDDFTNTFIKN